MTSDEKFPSIEQMDGIDPARREIVLLVKALIEDATTPINTYSQIIRDFDVIRLNKVQFTRMIKCVEGKSSDNLAGIKYSEILAILKRKYDKYLGGSTANVDVIRHSHNNYYFYYYESFSEKTNDYRVKFAVIGFDKEEATNEWEKGNIYYLNDYLEIHKVFFLERVKIENSNILFFTAKLNDQVNFFTLKVMGKPIDLRGIIPLTYSVLETQYKFPCAGVAILEKTTLKK